MSNYFSSILALTPGTASSARKKGEIVGSRRQRFFIKGFSSNPGKGLFFRGGDILKVNFQRGGQGYYFEGICLAIRKKNLINRHSSLVLRNIIGDVGIEVIISYYFNRIYALAFSDYKRKRFVYPKPKLYYLRLRSFKESAL